MIRSSHFFSRLAIVALLFALPGRGLPAARAALVVTQPPLAPLASHIFANSGQALGGETGNGVALGDLDGDGDVDAFVANDFTVFGEANQIWLNDGNGYFAEGPTLGTANGLAVALGDLDGDGDLDVFVVGAPLNYVWLNGEGGDPPGVFRRGIPVSAGGWDVALVQSQIRHME